MIDQYTGAPAQDPSRYREKQRTTPKYRIPPISRVGTALLSFFPTPTRVSAAIKMHQYRAPINPNVMHAAVSWTVARESKRNSDRDTARTTETKNKPQSGTRTTFLRERRKAFLFLTNDPPHMHPHSKSCVFDTKLGIPGVVYLSPPRPNAALRNVPRMSPTLFQPKKIFIGELWRAGKSCYLVPNSPPPPATRRIHKQCAAKSCRLLCSTHTHTPLLGPANNVLAFVSFPNASLDGWRLTQYIPSIPWAGRSRHKTSQLYHPGHYKLMLQLQPDHRIEMKRLAVACEWCGAGHAP